MQDRKEQLKKSRLGQVVMFLYKLPDETAGNRRMAKELVERWSRPIFEQYRDVRQTHAPCPSRHCRHETYWALLTLLAGQKLCF